MDIGVGLMLIGLFGVLTELLYLGGRTKVWMYVTHGVVARLIYTVGESMNIYERGFDTGADVFGLAFSMAVVSLLWLFQGVNAENYKQMQKTRQELDELLDSWRK